MSKFKQYKQLSLSKTHKEVLENWKKNDVFNQSIEGRKGNPTLHFMKDHLQQTECLVFTM